MTGLYPFVRLIEAEARVYDEAPRFLAGVKQALEEFKREQQRLRNRLSTEQRFNRAALKSIEAFRCNPRYAGDGTRIDLAYAVYAISHGASEAEVSAAIRSRDLSHKGNLKRQNDYVDRTVRKAVGSLDMAGRGR